MCDLINTPLTNVITKNTHVRHSFMNESINPLEYCQTRVPCINCERDCQYAWTSIRLYTRTSTTQPVHSALHTTNSHFTCPSCLPPKPYVGTVPTVAADQRYVYPGEVLKPFQNWGRSLKTPPARIGMVLVTTVAAFTGNSLSTRAGAIICSRVLHPLTSVSD